MRGFLLFIFVTGFSVPLLSANLSQKFQNAEHYWKRARYEKAYTIYKNIIEKEPTEAKYYAHAARVYSHMYNVKLAPLDTLSSEDSIRLTVYLERARELARTATTIDSANDLGYAVEFIIELALAKFDRGLRSQHWERAVTALNRLADLRPSHPYSWHALGTYHRIYADFSWETKAWLNLKYDLPAGGTLKAALECYQNANVDDPRQFNYLYMLAQLYKRLDKLNRARMYVHVTLSHSARSEYEQVIQEKCLELLDELEKS